MSTDPTRSTRFSLDLASGDALDVREVTVHEQISTLFSVTLRAVAASPDLDFEAIIARPARFEIQAGLAGVDAVEDRRLAADQDGVVRSLGHDCESASLPTDSSVRRGWIMATIGGRGPYRMIVVGYPRWCVNGPAGPGRSAAGR